MFALDQTLSALLHVQKCFGPFCSGSYGFLLCKGRKHLTESCYVGTEGREAGGGMLLVAELGHPTSMALRHCCE